jgi:hypothetical protein
MRIKTMIIRTCRWPIYFMMSCVAILVFMSFINSPGEASKVLAGFTSRLLLVSEYAFFASLALCIVTAIAAMHRLWKWDQGKIETVCRHCNGLVNYKPSGRFGPYYKCLACSENQQA